MAGAGQLTNVFDSYDAIGIREELSDLISDISPTDTPFISNIGSEDTGNTYFEWQTDALAAAAENHQIDGFDITTYTAVTATARIGNYTSISQKDFMISGTEEATNKAGRASEIAYQATKKGKELKRDLETNYTANNAAVAGDGTTARETGGLLAWLKTNVDKSATNGVDPVWTSAPTDARSGGEARAFTETILKNVMKTCYDAGAEPSMLMLGSFNKQAASAFAGIAAQRYMADRDTPTTIIGAADVYLSDFGTLQIVTNRFQPASAALFIDPDMARRRILRPYRLQELAKTGDADKFMLTCEEGLQIDNEVGHGIAADLTTS
jgi:hypothetical protein